MGFAIFVMIFTLAAFISCCVAVIRAFNRIPFYSTMTTEGKRDFWFRFCLGLTPLLIMVLFMALLIL